MGTTSDAEDTLIKDQRNLLIYTLFVENPAPLSSVANKLHFDPSTIKSYIDKLTINQKSIGLKLTDVAEQAFVEGVKTDSINTDIYSRNRIDGPVYDMATTFKKTKVIGYSWSEIIEKNYEYSS